MPSLIRHAGLLRDKTSPERARVSPVELFFDLVFVFAVTQLSHTLLNDLTLRGLIETTFLFLAMWWVWIYTTWVTNWLDPERALVRLLLFVLMLAGLVLSISIPTAFTSGALAFAAAYVFMQVGRSAFTIFALGTASPNNTRNFQRILAWFVLSGVFWVAGAPAEGSIRFLFWAIALGLEYLSPAVGFWVPRLGRSGTTDWNVEGEHLAERCGLFVIIALGESLLITGATFGKLPVTGETVIAFVIAFVGSVAMWWVYFAIGAERGTEHIAKADDPGRLARIGYTYLHLLIIAGIIVGAVADELVLAHPAGHVDGKTALAILGGPALFVLGAALFKRLSSSRFPLSHLVGLGMLAVLAVVHALLSPLALAALATATLVMVATWEWVSLHGGRSAHPG
jgi:low temperature requirement protein LtrA